MPHMVSNHFGDFLIQNSGRTKQPNKVEIAGKNEGNEWKEKWVKLPVFPLRHLL